MLIEGRNPVREALRAGVRVRRVVVAKGTDTRGALDEILELCAASRTAVEHVERESIDELAESRAHQGVIADIGEFAYGSWKEAARAARDRGEVPLVVALDGITDPQNTGSLIRSAHIFGAHAVLLPARRAAPVTPVVVKASAGAIWHQTVDQVGNLERALAECKKEGLWVAGLDGDADIEVSNCPLLSEPLALVVGSEGKGLSHLIKQRADVLVKIPQTGRIDSLGAAVAGAIALYETARARAV